MAFSTSGLFGQTLVDILAQTTAIDLNTDTFKLALFNNTPTPDFSAAASLVAYNTGQWVSGNEVTGTGWAAGGVALTGVVLTLDAPAAGQFMFDSDDVSQAGTTLTDIYGCLIYDDTIATPVADQGLLAVAFSGAPYQTTNGTLTITVDPNGWFYSDFTP